MPSRMLLDVDVGWHCDEWWLVHMVVSLSQLINHVQLYLYVGDDSNLSNSSSSTVQNSIRGNFNLHHRRFIQTTPENDSLRSNKYLSIKADKPQKKPKRQQLLTKNTLKSWSVKKLIKLVFFFFFNICHTRGRKRFKLMTFILLSLDPTD